MTKTTMAVKLVGIGRLRVYWYPYINPVWGKVASALFIGKLSIQKIGGKNEKKD